MTPSTCLGPQQAARSLTDEAEVEPARALVLGGRKVCSCTRSDLCDVLPRKHPIRQLEKRITHSASAPQPSWRTSASPCKRCARRSRGRQLDCGGSSCSVGASQVKRGVQSALSDEDVEADNGENDCIAAEVAGSITGLVHCKSKARIERTKQRRRDRQHGKGRTIGTDDV